MKLRELVRAMVRLFGSGNSSVEGAVGLER